MAVTITMPKLGLTMNSGSVQEWKKNIGDSVSQGEILFTVATDKLTVDVESAETGVLLSILVELGQEVEVGAPLAVIGQAGEEAAVTPAETQTGPAPAKQPTGSETSPAGTGPVPAASTTSAPISSDSASPGADKLGRIPSSPKAKKLAREMGIDLGGLKGSGPGGWVVAKDVLAASATGSGPAKASPLAAKMAAEAGFDLSGVQATGPGGKIMKEDLVAAARKILREAGATDVSSGGERRLPITQMRRVIGQRMLASTTSIPTVNYFAEVDMGALAEFRASCNARLARNSKGEESVKISLNDILMKFCARLLLDYPLLNGSVEEDAFVMHDYANIGLAVALPGGLLVPNVKNVQDKSLSRLAAERADLVRRARAGTLLPDEMSGATFSISNLGMMGIDAFTPIINPPEVAILGVGSTREKPAVFDGAVVPRPVAVFSLSADHRLVDGADAAVFLAKLKELVENPGFFLL